MTAEVLRELIRVNRTGTKGQGGSTLLTGYKGPALHRAWGAGLKRVAPQFYAVMNPVAGLPGAPSTPNPYAFAAPGDLLVDYPRGHNFEIGLTLFGTACQGAMASIEAMTHMGARGWGEPLGRFQVLGVSQYSPNAGWQPMLDLQAGTWLAQPHPCSVSDLIAPRIDGLLNVRFASPTELQEREGSLNSAPSFEQLIRAITGRAQQLATNYAGVALIDTDEKRRLRELTQGIRLVRQDTECVVVEDHARNGTRWYRGILGTAVYQGDFKPFQSWLALAEIIHIGKKTSYGFGRIQLGE